MSEKHSTPGPWKWELADYSMAILHGPDNLADHVLCVSPCDACMKRAAELEAHPYWEWSRCTTPSEANAMLIAAAPLLRDALQALVGWVEAETDSRDLPLPALEQARKALQSIWLRETP
jgi:hypothetical protein